MIQHWHIILLISIQAIIILFALGAMLDRIERLEEKNKNKKPVFPFKIIGDKRVLENQILFINDAGEKVGEIYNFRGE